MSIKSIHIVNYKNYNDQKVHFDDGIIAVVGNNGMGKTNLLDAIYYVCIGKSYFTSSDKNVANKEAEFFRIVSDLDYNLPQHVIVKVKPSKLKSIEVNSVKLEKISDHIGSNPVVMIAPIDIQLLLEGSEPRRLFMNNSIVQYSKSYLDNLLTYNRLLKQRNALLKQFNERRYFDKTLIEAINVKMFEPASIIYSERANFIKRISPIFEETYYEISGGQEKCTLLYKSQLESNKLSSIFEKNSEKDRILMRTSSGVHRDDIVFIMNGDPLKTFASQGQLKSFILSLKLAQYHLLHQVVGKKPILLLDDLFDKLDTNRVTFLLQRLTNGTFGQVFISDTDVNRIPSILKSMAVSYQTLEIKNGSIVTNEKK